MKWKLYTSDESHQPPLTGFETKQHETEVEAFEEAYQLMYGPAHRPHFRVLRIEGPNGEEFYSEQIEEFFQKRSEQRRP